MERVSTNFPDNPRRSAVAGCFILISCIKLTGVLHSVFSYKSEQREYCFLGTTLRDASLQIVSHHNKQSSIKLLMGLNTFYVRKRKIIVILNAILL